MKKSTTKKLTKNQLEYKKQYERISKAIKKKEKEGYEFPKLPITKNRRE